MFKVNGELSSCDITYHKLNILLFCVWNLTLVIQINSKLVQTLIKSFDETYLPMNASPPRVSAGKSCYTEGKKSNKNGYSKFK